MEISDGFFRASNGIFLGLFAESQPIHLREDKPHPMARFSAIQDFFQCPIIGGLLSRCKSVEKKTIRHIFIVIHSHKNSYFILKVIKIDSNGPIPEKETSINFLTKKKKVKLNTNENYGEGEEAFEETWEDISVNRLIKLLEIKDVDALGMDAF